MARQFNGWGLRKDKSWTSLYVGNDLNACKSAVQTAVNGGTYSKGIWTSPLSPTERIINRNPAGA
jgi:hypothetical protein